MTFCGIISMALTILLIILNALYNSILFIEVACVTNWITHWTFNPEVKGFFLGQDVFKHDIISEVDALFVMINTRHFAHHITKIPCVKVNSYMKKLFVYFFTKFSPIKA